MLPGPVVTLHCGSRRRNPPLPGSIVILCRDKPPLRPSITRPQHNPPLQHPPLRPSVAGLLQVSTNQAHMSINLVPLASLHMSHPPTNSTSTHSTSGHTNKPTILVTFCTPMAACQAHLPSGNPCPSSCPTVPHRSLPTLLALRPLNLSLCLLRERKHCDSPSQQTSHTTLHHRDPRSRPPSPCSIIANPCCDQPSGAIIATRRCN